MKCNFKWLSLYLDGELSQRKMEKLEKHLQMCEACAEKLEEMKELEALAAQAKLPQVSEAYWENFSARVKNKLLLREKESPSTVFWKRISGAFQTSPFRLKVVAAVASVMIVAWVGKIYMDYRPAPVERQLQSPSLTLPEKAQTLPETVGTFLPSIKEEKDVVNAVKTTEPKPKESVSAEQFSTLNQLEGAAPFTREESRGESVSVQLPPEVVKGEKPVIEKDVTANLRRISGKNIEPLPVKKVDELLAVQDTAGELHVRGGRAGEVIEPAEVKTQEFAPSAIGNKPAGVFPVDVTKDSISRGDSLRNAIERQESIILTQPSDSIQEKSYQDLAQSYLNLCVLTKNKEDIEVAQKRIREILQKYLYAKTRISLNNILTQLKNLERSLE